MDILRQKRARLLLKHLGSRYPVVQSPMGWIARAQLASAVSRAGGLGMIETSSGEIDNCMAEIDLMRAQAPLPFAVNVPLMLLRDPRMLKELLSRSPHFVTTSAGSPEQLLPKFKEVGTIVYHSVATMAMVDKAARAGVDGLILEGHEGGGFKNAAGVSSLVLVRAARERYPELPMILAGGIADGIGMAAALMAGADGVQMGTRFVASLESPVHDNYKNAIINATSDDTLIVNRSGKPLMRTLGTKRAHEIGDGPMNNETLGAVKRLYFEGDMDASVALSGQSAAMIRDLPAVAQIMKDLIEQANTALREGDTLAQTLSESLSQN
jgi:enoyl-[acyl-carrier protein] reductase II